LHFFLLRCKMTEKILCSLFFSKQEPQNAAFSRGYGMLAGFDMHSASTEFETL
jgi:hypothetical protein